MTCLLLFTDITLICRYEDYVDQKYKEHLKNQGKVDSVRTDIWSIQNLIS